jgi:hypothetical protein
MTVFPMYGMKPQQDPSGIGMVGGLGDIVDNVMKYTQCRGVLLGDSY